ncbi:MAG: NADH-quinone oxidoreductase subunit C [Gemmataceae bacterium]
MMTYAEVLQELKTRFGADSFTTSQFRDNCRIHVAPAEAYSFLEFLKNSCGFDMLAELAGIDYLHYPDAKDRFGIVYGLLDCQTGTRLFVKTALNEPDLEIRSVYSLWRGADWLEREIYDMYGVIFVGHPDLRRILMPEEATCYPLRKDYPMRGRGERHNFPALTRAEG